MQIPINQPQYLFSYGILQEKQNQLAYGLTEVEEYCTLSGFLTRGYGGGSPLNRSILHMVPSDDPANTVSGVLLRVPGGYDWTALDQLEADYDRVRVDSYNGDESLPVWAYIEKTTKGEQ